MGRMRWDRIGMGRILNPLREKYSNKLSRFDVTLVRRWADLEQTDKQIIDTIEMTEQPHHGTDVKSYFGDDAVTLSTGGGGTASISPLV